MSFLVGDKLSYAVLEQCCCGSQCLVGTKEFEIVSKDGWVVSAGTASPLKSRWTCTYGGWDAVVG